MAEDHLALTVESRPDGLTIGSSRGEPVLRQHVGQGCRAYIHPIHAPGGAGVLTENEPDHHPWQHGLYIGLNDVNGLGFWTEGLHPERGASDGGFTSRLDGPATTDAGGACWSVVSDYLDKQRHAMLGERQDWALALSDHRLQLDLTWTLHARRDLVFGKYDYGGPFLRMPYRHNLGGKAFDSAGQRESGRRARWVAVQLPLPDTGRQAQAVLLDHASNPGSPVVWRIDNELGIGPAPSAEAAWGLPEDGERAFRYRLVVFGEPADAQVVDDAWQRYCEDAK
jgi:Methane oxygenase PmoA